MIVYALGHPNGAHRPAPTARLHLFTADRSLCGRLLFVEHDLIPVEADAADPRICRACLRLWREAEKIEQN